MSFRLYAAVLATAGGLFAAQGVGATQVANGLTINGLTINGLTINGRATNGTASAAVTLLAVILPDGSRVTLN
jgi:hypothetical protein